MGSVSGAHFEDASNPVWNRSIGNFLFLRVWSDPNVLVDLKLLSGDCSVLAMDAVSRRGGTKSQALCTYS